MKVKKLKEKLNEYPDDMKIEKKQRPPKPYMPVIFRKEYKWIYVGGKWKMHRIMNVTGNLT